MASDRHGIEAVERAAIRYEARPLLLEDLPDCALRRLRMPVRPGPGNASILEPGVELLVALHLHPRREEALPDGAHLVLDLALLPARRRRAGDRVDEIMAAHLQEAAVVGALPADEDRIHRGPHVVVDAACAGPAEEGERPVVRVEDHLLRLPRIGADEHHAAVAEPDMRHLHRRGHAVDHHDLVAPVELVRLPGCKGQRYERRGRSLAFPALPGGRIPSNGIVAAVVAQPAQLFEDADQRQALPARPRPVRGQEAVQLVTPGADLRLGLGGPLVAELRLLRADDLAHRPPRNPQLADNRLDRLPLNEIGATDLRDRLHNQHPNLGPR